MDSIPFTRSIDLPPYRAILAVDAKGFTAEPGSTHEAISKDLLTLVGDALTGAGLRAEWDRPAFLGPAGDGFAVGLSTHVLPYLVDPFMALLQERLAEHNRHARALIQLRVSLHVGPLPADPENPHWTGNGKPRNDTHRLLDSAPVRAVLAAASSHVTFVACIFSDRVFEDVIAAGYAKMRPEQCLPVTATVDGKAFSRPAWLYVPKVSGNLLGVLPTAPPPSTKVEKARQSPISGPRVKRNTGQVATAVENMTQHRGGDR